MDDLRRLVLAYFAARDRLAASILSDKQPPECTCDHPGGKCDFHNGLHREVQDAEDALRIEVGAVEPIIREVQES